MSLTTALRSLSSERRAAAPARARAARAFMNATSASDRATLGVTTGRFSGQDAADGRAVLARRGVVSSYRHSD